MLIALLLAVIQPAVAEPTILVEGARKTDPEIRQEALSFVKAVAAQPGAADQLARWNQAICIKVIGATLTEEKAVADHIREAAAETRIRISRRKGCEPNILVAFTDAPGDVVRAVFAKRPQSARGVPAVERASLVDGVYPVRWWYDFKTEGRYGEMPIGDHPALLNSLDTNPGGAPGGAFAQAENQSGNVSDYSSSMIGSKSRQSIGAATIIVDTRRTRGLSDDALASFVAMVALAPLKLPPRPVPTPTITNLFSAAAAERETELTQWDRAYLAALYKVPANRSADVQRSAITAQIAREMRGEK